MAADYDIKRVTLDTVTWTALVAPFNCNNLRIENEDATAIISVRTNVADATTEKKVWPQAYISVEGVMLEARHPRFKKGETAASARVDTGTGPAVVEFS